ncbi:Anaphase-promoting complex subunit 5 [Mortierella alpina]|nr:Anaphase-promoting complex subunit 5 [Mortierella alpina]
MGLYVRKAQIEYKRLLFEDMCRFYTAFETYVSALDRHSSAKEPASEAYEELSVMSVFDLEKFLDLQAEQLSRTASSKRSGASEVQLLANLAGKSEGQAFQYLHSLSELTIAKQMQGESIAKALEALVKASSINLRHSLDSIGGVAQLFQSRIWSTYGMPSLSSLYAQLQLHYHPTETDMSDAASGYSKHASDLALTGRYKEALEVIEVAKAKFPLKTMKATPWVQTLVQVLQRRAMSMNRLRDVEVWNQQLATTLVNTSILAMNPETGASPRAEEKSGGLHTHDNQMDGTSLEMQLDILLQKALLSVLVGHAHAGEQQLSEGLTIIRQNQWPGTHKFTIMYLLALAEIYMATDLVDGIMTTVLSQGDLFVQALAYFQSAKCLFAQLNRAAPSLETFDESEMLSQARDSSRQQDLRRVTGLLQHALESFERLESLRDVVQVLYFQARAYRELCMEDSLERTLIQFKATSLKVAELKNQHEPSWYSYYFTRDAFNGILRSEDETADQRSVPGQKKSSGLSSQGRGRMAAGGLPRTGSTHWSTNSGSSLKRTPSQLWQSVVAPARPLNLPTHEEGQGQAAPSTDAHAKDNNEDKDDEEDGDVDMIVEGGHQLDPDDEDSSPGHSKRRRVEAATIRK